MLTYGDGDGDGEDKRMSDWSSVQLTEVQDFDNNYKEKPSI